ncbi:MAG: PstS family phosphate ABC transporter substrate-binding protein [Leptolyngbya sp. SIO3F4]|nr:PstS family phosphate ABC transporter substrate-binding protein [Leptolyngbya sp. SIO3F4]
MEQRQDKVLLSITLAGLGLIAAIFGLFAWLVGGGSFSGPTLKSSNSNDSGAKTAPVPVSEEQLNTVQDVPEGLFNYGGSTTWIPVHESVNDAITNAFPEFQLRYTLPSTGAPGSGTGIKMLLDGQLSFSESSRPLKTKEYDEAQKRGFSLEQIPAALDGIALAVHPDLDLEGLTVAQIQNIYTNEVTNWSEVGGPDLPITAYSRSPEAAGTAKYFLDSIIDAESYGTDVVFVEDTTTGVRQVLDDKGGIYYASAPEIVNQCSIYAIPVASQDQPDNFIPPFADSWKTGQDCINQANTVNKTAFRDGAYPLTRRLFVIVKVDEAIDESAGRAYANMLLSPRGQTLVEEAGFVGIR